MAVFPLRLCFHVFWCTQFRRALALSSKSKHGYIPITLVFPSYQRYTLWKHKCSATVINNNFRLTLFHGQILIYFSGQTRNQSAYVVPLLTENYCTKINMALVISPLSRACFKPSQFIMNDTSQCCQSCLIEERSIS